MLTLLLTGILRCLGNAPGPAVAGQAVLLWLPRTGHFCMSVRREADKSDNRPEIKPTLIFHYFVTG